MNAAPLASDTSVSAPRVVARIDTQELSFVIPVQEFLALYGCTVMVNAPYADNPDYHIAIGDVDFVKRIFVGPENPHTKRLGVIWGQDPLPSVMTKNFGTAKFAFVSMGLLSSRLITDIFQFFFTDTTRVRDFRTVEEKVKIRPPDTQQGFADDRNRIANLVQDLFVHKIEKKRRMFMPNLPASRQVIAKITTRLFLVGMLFFLPIFWYVGIIAAAVLTDVQVFKYLSAGKTEEAARWYTIASTVSRAAEKTHAVSAVPFYWFGGYPLIRPYEQGIDILKKISGIEESVLRIAHTTQTLGKSIVAPTESTPNAVGVATLLSIVRNELMFLVGQLGLVQAGLVSLGREDQMPIAWLRGEITKMESRVVRTREQVNNLSRMIQLFGSLGGFDKRQTYLLLFQNSMELRPTGGFIGSIGTVSFSQGQLMDLLIQDVYVVDGQLKGHVDPPEPMASLLGSEHWYLRDSNWDPDFRQSASRAAWFYEKETGTRVDGVIGVSVPLLVEFLRETGPITLVDFSDTITAENFFTKSLYYTQENFFPGSTQKKDFLGALARAIILKLQSVDNAPGIMRTILTGLESRTFMMYVGDIDAQEMIEQYGWSGRVPQRVPCRGLPIGTGECVGGFLSVVEANLGVNKTNYFLKRSITNHITLDGEGNIHETIFVEYINGDTAGIAQGAGAYLSYVRFLVSPGSTVELLQVDGADVTQRVPGRGLVIPPYADSVEVSKDYLSVPVAISVPPGAVSRVSLSLVRNGNIVGMGTPIMFQYMVQKQPGTSDDELWVSISYPLHWVLSAQTLGAGPLTGTSMGDFLAKEGRVQYNTTLSTDRTATFLFSR